MTSHDLIAAFDAVAEAPDGSLYLIDQHRAHERVIYEHLRRLHASGQHDEAIDAHLLLEPVIVELKRHEAELFEPSQTRPDPE